MTITLTNGFLVTLTFVVFDLYNPEDYFHQSTINNQHTSHYTPITPLSPVTHPLKTLQHSPPPLVGVHHLRQVWVT